MVPQNSYNPTEWVPISHLIENGLYSNTYFVNRNGQIKGPRKILTGKIDKYGYRVVVLSVNGHHKHMTVHRIVALTFLDNPGNRITVNHIDGNKLNNCISNLEWSTSLNNSRHAGMMGLMHIPNGEHLNKIKDIVSRRKGCLSPVSKQITIEGTVYGSIALASRELKISESTIRRWVKTRDDVFINKNEIIGIMGGSFDPITNAHIEMIREIKRRNYVDKIFVIPSYSHTQKNNVTSYNHRLEMCKQALCKYPYCSVLDIESTIPDFDGSYMMLYKYLTSQYPDITFKNIIGQDCAERIHTWKYSDDLLTTCQFMVLPRDDIETRFKWYMKPPHKFLRKVTVLPISSTMVRAHSDISTCDLISDAVRKYIIKHQLYGAS